MVSFREIYYGYSAEQRRNIGIYIAGIMFYKLGLEFFNGSITSLITDRFRANNALQNLGIAQGLNQAMQCVGAILIAPLVKMKPTRTILAIAVWGFALMTSVLLIVDAATGGSIKKNNKVDYGNWNINAVYPIWGIAGVFYGMVELIRRVIPADICGSDVNKLRRMDATTHVFYEVAGTAGAFASSSAISRFGNNYSFFLSPIFFTCAGLIWIWISALSFKKPVKGQENDAGLSAVEHGNKGMGYLRAVGQGTIGFGKSVWVGGKLIFGNRAFIWLFPAYSIALYLHRFLESSLAPAYARRVLGQSAWSQILVGGSNFGELLGAATVFLLSDKVPTPLPWLRLDALALNLVWVLPRFAVIAKRNVTWAWIPAACFLPISYGWAAGDVSLAAYIQHTISEMDLADSGVSPLGAVMAFLYSSYVVLNAVLSSLLGKVIDKDFTATKTITQSLKQVGGIQFSVGCVIILLATLIPAGALALNPKAINKHLHTGEDSFEGESSLDGAMLKHGGDGIDVEKPALNSNGSDSEHEKNGFRREM